MPIQLLSTDFDGTLFAEFADPPIPAELGARLEWFQREGGRWVINTGRDLGSLLETLGRTHFKVHPDALVLVEREIFLREDGHYLPLAEWNRVCSAEHEALFALVAPDLRGLTERLSQRHPATFYQDAFSPLCVIAETTSAADALQRDLEAYAEGVPRLAVVRNDVYIRLAHAAFNKGTALAELARRWGLGPEGILAAGDHYNDLPMLDPQRAAWLVAPANAIPEVQDQVRRAGGYVSDRRQGDGVLAGIEHFLRQVGPPR